MGLEHLLEALERDANAQVERLLAQARAEAERLTAAGAAERERRACQARARGEQTRNQEVEHAVTLARRHARHALLEARERLLERVFAAARALLPAALARPDYRETLPAALAAALAAVGDQPSVIRCSQGLAPDLKRSIPGGRASVVVDASVGSGFRLATADGAVEVDETLDVRLERFRPLLARRVLTLLQVEA